MPDDFRNVYCSADGSSSRFNADFFCSAMKERDTCKDIVHYRLFPNQDRVDFGHALASLLVYFLSGLSKDFFENKYVVVQAFTSR